jgi:F420-0:gamma-glutamyl ligase-like protein
LKVKARSIRTHYWKPNTDYASVIVTSIKDRVSDGDLVLVSEKAIAVASGLIVDESKIKPGHFAKWLASVWIRRFWGGPIGRISRLRSKTIENLREYPIREGSAHKQLVLRSTGLLQALRHYSEGGIDASNLPYSYVCLPIKGSEAVATKIREAILSGTRVKTTVIIVDGDVTFSWRNIHLAPRRVQTPGLIYIGGVFTFILGRFFNLKARQTPIAISGEKLNPDRILWLAKLHHRLCGKGVGRTVWSMSKHMKTSFTGITWGMLDSVEHRPITLVSLED